MANIGIIGCGFVGSTMARVLSRAGHNVLAYDRCPERCAGFYSDIDFVAARPIIFLCLPTVPTADGAGMDLAPLHDVCDGLRGTQSIVVLRSSVLPGTTRKLAEQHRIENMVFMPEFLTMKTAEVDFRLPDRLIFGTLGRIDIRALLQVFAAWDCPKIVTSAETAELTKLASNCLFAVKVAFANEWYEYAQHLGVEWREVRDLLYMDPRIGCDHLTVDPPRMGRGFGGACLPKDTYQMACSADAAGLPATMLRAALQVNRRLRPDKKEWEP